MAKYDATDIRSFREGNYVVYAGPIQSRRDMIGVVEEVGENATKGATPDKLYRIRFGNNDDAKFVVASAADMRGIMIGTLSLYADTLAEFGFTHDPSVKWHTFFPIAVSTVVTTVVTEDKVNQTAIIEHRVYKVGEHPVDPSLEYISVGSIHEIQNYLTDQFGSDYIAASNNAIVGSQWGPSTGFKVIRNTIS